MEGGGGWRYHFTRVRDGNSCAGWVSAVLLRMVTPPGPELPVKSINMTRENVVGLEELGMK